MPLMMTCLPTRSLSLHFAGLCISRTSESFDVDVLTEIVARRRAINERHIRVEDMHSTWRVATALQVRNSRRRHRAVRSTPIHVGDLEGRGAAVRVRPIVGGTLRDVP